jgi:hypothetical protein
MGAAPARQSASRQRCMCKSATRFLWAFPWWQCAGGNQPADRRNRTDTGSSSRSETNPTIAPPKIPQHAARNGRPCRTVPSSHSQAPTLVTPHTDPVNIVRANGLRSVDASETCTRSVASSGMVEVSHRHGNSDSCAITLSSCSTAHDLVPCAVDPPPRERGLPLAVMVEHPTAERS